MRTRAIIVIVAAFGIAVADGRRGKPAAERARGRGRLPVLRVVGLPVPAAAQLREAQRPRLGAPCSGGATARGRAARARRAPGRRALLGVRLPVRRRRARVDVGIHAGGRRAGARAHRRPRRRPWGCGRRGRGVPRAAEDAAHADGRRLVDPRVQLHGQVILNAQLESILAVESYARIARDRRGGARRGRPRARGAQAPAALRHRLLGPLRARRRRRGPALPDVSRRPAAQARGEPRRADLARHVSALEPLPALEFAGVKPNRSMPSAVVIPVLIYPDVREAVAWLSEAFGFVGAAADRREPSLPAQRRRRRRRDRRRRASRAAAAAARRGHALGDGARRRRPRPLRARESARRAHRHGAGRLRVRRAAVQAEDPAGHQWTFSETLDDVDPEEWGGILVRPGA